MRTKLRTATLSCHDAPSDLLSPGTKQVRSSAIAILTILITCLISIQCFLPLRTAVQIGADEGFELSKATLCLNGYKLYTEVWNDQPPLHTFVLTQVLKHVSPSILAARVLTSVFAAILLGAVFFISLRVSGLFVATLGTALLLVSPGFVELSASCMLEIPGLALAVTALSLLLGVEGSSVPGKPGTIRSREILAGVAFAFALQIKLIGVILLPVAALTLWLGTRFPKKLELMLPDAHFQRDIASLFRSLIVLGGTFVLAFLAIDFWIEGGAFLLNFHQSWSSHFGEARSFEYGSAHDHPFDWSILLKNWDTFAPALLGLIVCLRGKGLGDRSLKAAGGRPLLPVVWLVLMLSVFATHRPWWAYYYIHVAIPLCWCAAIGLEAAWRFLDGPRKLRGATYRREHLSYGLAALFGIYALCAAGWIGSRVYLQMEGIRNSPQTYSTLVLQELERLRHSARFMYADESIYSFHSGIPMLPDLAVVPLKRLWAGGLTNAQIAAKLEETQPEILLLRNDTREVPFQDLIFREYRLAFEDASFRLYTKKSIGRRVGIL